VTGHYCILYVIGHIVVLFYRYVSISVCVGLCITTCICPAFYAAILVINMLCYVYNIRRVAFQRRMIDVDTTLSSTWPYPRYIRYNYTTTLDQRCSLRARSEQRWSNVVCPLKRSKTHWNFKKNNKKSVNPGHLKCHKYDKYAYYTALQVHCWT